MDFFSETELHLLECRVLTAINIEELYGQYVLPPVSFNSAEKLIGCFICSTVNYCWNLRLILLFMGFPVIATSY